MLTRQVIVPNHPDKERCLSLREVDEMLNNNVWHVERFVGHKQVMFGEHCQLQVLVQWAESWWNIHDEIVNSKMEKLMQYNVAHKLSDTTGMYNKYVACFSGVLCGEKKWTKINSL